MAFLTDVGRVGAFGAGGALAPLGRAWRRFAKAYVDYRLRTAAEIELQGMSNRELADIGITRSEIHERVWRR